MPGCPLRSNICANLAIARLIACQQQHSSVLEPVFTVLERLIREDLRILFGRRVPVSPGSMAPSLG